MLQCPRSGATYDRRAIAPRSITPARSSSDVDADVVAAAMALKRVRPLQNEREGVGDRVRRAQADLRIGSGLQLRSPGDTESPRAL
jgi:hypothetical protein